MQGHANHEQLDYEPQQKFRNHNAPRNWNWFSWRTTRGATAILLNVVRSLPHLPGDFNGNDVADADDYVLRHSGGPLQNDPLPGIQSEDDTSKWARLANPSVGGDCATGAGSGLAAALHRMTLPAGGSSWFRRPGRLGGSGNKPK
jgi:hypothetical protein